MYRIKIERDNNPLNPREDWDNADVMYCEHRRYTLGDKDADKPVHEASYVELCYLRPDGTSACYVLDDRDNDHELHPIYDDVLAMLEEHRDEASDEAGAPPEPNEAPDAQAMYDAAVERAQSAVDYVRKATWESEWRDNPGIAIIRPLYLYDHGGITISAGAFSCPWDSGQVGWQYVTDEALAAEWNGDRDRALAYMDATLSTYDDYIQGNVHGFMLEKGEIVKVTTEYPDGTTSVHEEIEWEDEDSCWGFIGDWYGKDDPTGMREHLPREVEALFDSLTWSDQGEWRYSEDVPEELQCD